MNIDIKSWCDQIKGSHRRVALPIMTHPGIEFIGATVFDAVTKGEVHFNAIMALNQHFDMAAATMIMDLTVEAEAFGSTINFEQNDIPTITGRLVQNSDDIEQLAIPDITVARLPEYLKAAQLAVANINNVPVFPGCIGPFSLAGRLFDITEIMTAIYLEPEATHQLLYKCTQFLKNYIAAYKQLGVHGIVMAEPAAGLLGEEECTDFSSNYIKSIVDYFQDDNFIIIVHNCGHHGNLAETMASTGAAALHLGNAANMQLVLETVPRNVLVLGNLDPVSIFKLGTPEYVQSKTTELLMQAKGYPNFVISSGCDLPPNVPIKNIEAFFSAIEAFNDEN